MLKSSNTTFFSFTIRGVAKSFLNFLNSISIHDFFLFLEEPEIPVPPRQPQTVCGGRACPACGKCRDWYYDNRYWKRRDGATCSYDDDDFNSHRLRRDDDDDFNSHRLRRLVCNCK
jgi:hypothetical protein